MEGVMMRGQKTLVTAVRHPKGQVITDTQRLSPLYSGPARRMPFVRGVIVMIESMVLGIKSLLYSANISLEEEGEKVSGGLVWLMLIVALGLMVILFYIVPLLLTRLLNIESSILFNIVDGLIRVTIFVIYLRLMGLMRDLKRVFAYHGAEHKVVNAYEAGVPMETDAVRRFSTAHVRCGTSFLFAVVMISILVFALVGIRSTWLMVLSRIVLIPVIAAVSYEIIYFAGRHSDHIFARILSAPGLWLQSLTTREPDDGQIEVALVALKGVIAAEQPDGLTAASAPPGTP
ncbi:MAG: hypothetical protein A2147_04045 [Chloroflexi bacterium RBG_16_57_8]|nr:MAG: hypothetical protein A2147_04045 [Chloroflexi bacterium RBG_16_57_8]